MPSIREFLGPTRKILAQRLDQLCTTLECIGTRLRTTIANAIGEMIGGLVRDTALSVLRETARCIPCHDPPLLPWPGSNASQTSRDGFEMEEDGYWADDYAVRDNHSTEDQRAPSSPERLPTALSAGLQTASWWLRRWSGRGRTLTTFAAGLLATALAFLGGPTINVILGLVESVTQFASFSDAIDTGASMLNVFNST